MNREGEPRIDYSQPLAGVDVGGQEERVSGANRERGKYYGVGDDYLAVEPARPHSRPANPRQADGIAERVITPQYQTASDDDRRILRNLGPEGIRAVQDALSQVGLIRPNSTFRTGIVDSVTRKAFADLLGYANQEGLDWKTALVKYAGEGGMQGDGDPVGGGSDVQPEAVTEVANPVTLEQQVQQAALSRLGRKLRGGEVQRFITVYQSLERGSNAEVLAAREQAQDGIAGEVTDGPSMDASALDYIDDNFATEAASQDTYGYYEALKQLIDGR